MSDPTTCDCVKRDDAQSLAADGWPFHRILIATDGSHTGARALQMGARLAGIGEAQLGVVYVVNNVAGFSPQFAWGPHTYEAEYTEKAHELLDRLTRKLPLGLAVERIVRVGDPGKEIVAVAETWKPDLLIVGGPSHRRLGRLLLGSVDEAVLDRVHCCVLILPPDAEPASR